MSEMVKVAVDAMGGDNAPLEIVKGAVEAANENSKVKVCLVGAEDIIKKEFRNIGIDSEKITTHSLRHTAITLSLIGGTPLQEVQQMARHTNINTTLIYAHNLNRIESHAEDNIQKLLSD